MSYIPSFFPCVCVHACTQIRICMYVPVHVSCLLCFSRSILSLVLLLAESNSFVIYRSMGFDITLPKGMKVFKNVSGEKDRINFRDGIHNQIRQR